MKWHAQSKILIQGIAEPLGSHYGSRMKAYGTTIVSGVSPGHRGQNLGDIPVFDLVEDAIAAFGAIDISLLLVPPYQVLDAALEAIAAGIRQLIIGTAGVPPLDMITLLKAAQASQTLVLGSGSPGILVPGQFWLGLWEPQFYLPGSVGILSRSDRLTDDIARELSAAGIGQSLVLGLGTDGILGTNLAQGLQILEEDDATAVILLIGQVNSNDENDAVDYIVANIEKPVIAYFPGHRVPLTKSLRNANAIIADQLSPPIFASNSQDALISAFQSAGLLLADRPSEIINLVRSVLNSLPPAPLSFPEPTQSEPPQSDPPPLAQSQSETVPSVRLPQKRAATAPSQAISPSPPKLTPPRPPRTPPPQSQS